MAQTQVNIRMDEILKKDWEAICDELGISLTAAVTVFAKKMIREKRIPFDVSIESEPRKIIIWAEDPPDGVPDGEPEGPGYIECERG